MAVLLGIDTGGTFTDAVLLEDTQNKVLARAKALTSRPNLAEGIGAALDRVIALADGVTAQDVALVSLSTTLATNALVEGQTASAALVLIGFDEADRKRAGLDAALGTDPIITLDGGHTHDGTPAHDLDLATLDAALSDLPGGVSAVAVASQFATRNPAHELAARELIRNKTGLPVTCSHELSAALNGPKRALTALLNARLISMIDQLIIACERHMRSREINAPLMVVRGDGALVSAAQVRERPIETILSGPAASVAGAAWLTGEDTALVSDIGGTTTDVCMLKDGRPTIDPLGARVGAFRTMVEAVAMRTTGLGGDSEVHVEDGLDGKLRLGPRRMMPLSLAATKFPKLVHEMLDAAMRQDIATDDAWQLAIGLFEDLPDGLPAREASIAQRLLNGPVRRGALLKSRVEAASLAQLVQRGLVLIAGPTPSDAAHVLKRQDTWDYDAACKAMTLLARKRTGAGTRLSENAEQMAQKIIDQLTHQTACCLLETAFGEDDLAWPEPATSLSQSALIHRALNRSETGTVQLHARVTIPVVALGASAHCYYGAVGERLDCATRIPKDAGVANAIGAVVGQVSMRTEGLVSSPNPGIFIAHLTEGPQRFDNADTAVAAVTESLKSIAMARAIEAGVDSPRINFSQDTKSAEIEGQTMIVEIRISATAEGRPRIANS